MKQNQNNGLSDLVEQIPNPPQWLRDALAVPREQGFVDVDGCPIHYFRWGDSSKPGILMTHGFLAHARCFAFIAPFLANDYHIVAFDMSGMGNSGHHDEYPEEVRVKELISVAEQTGLCEHKVKPVMIAHSFGGMIATAASYQHADKFSGLIICDLMIIRPEILAENQGKFAPPGGRGRERPQKVYSDYESARKRFVLAPPQSVNEAVLMEYMAYHSMAQVDAGWSWKFDPWVMRRGANAEERWLKVGQRVAKAPIRKTIVHGENSLLCNQYSEQYLDELCDEFGLDKIPFIAIPNAHHHLMLDQPMAFASTLRSILTLWRTS